MHRYIHKSRVRDMLMQAEIYRHALPEAQAGDTVELMTSEELPALRSAMMDSNDPLFQKLCIFAIEMSGFKPFDV